MNNKNTIIALAIVILVIVGIIAFTKNNNGDFAVTTDENNQVTKEAPTGPLADFATCIKGSGAIFYGAFWCPHCQEQKALFKDAAESLPYVECSTPDGQSQLPVCTEAGVTGYPTWKFADESKLSGVQSFATLAEKTSCPLPE